MFCFCYMLGMFPTFGVDAGAYTHYFLDGVVMLSPFALYEEFDLTGCFFTIPIEVWYALCFDFFAVCT